jgi:ATP-binding cassette subfamily F protein 2
MPKKEKLAKQAAFQMQKELDSEMTDEQRERMVKSGMGVGVGGMNAGADELFEKKLTKEEKKALAAQKKAEREAKKAAKAAEAGGGDDDDDGAEEGGGEEGEASSSAAPAKKPLAKATSKKGMKKKGSDTDLAAQGGVENEALASGGTQELAVVSAVLASRADSKDVKIAQFSISLFGKIIFEDQTLELTYGHRYGLVAQNGAGKSTFLKVVAARQIPIPDFIDIWFLDHEAEPSDRSAKDFVIDTVRLEKERLEKLEEDIMSDVGPEDPRLEAIYEKLDKLDPSTFDKRAGELLYGLGFSQQMMSRATKDMSGGWRMRVALAQALFVKPMLLVLDEPTNHLDLGACVWLEDYLAKWESCLLMTSHSQDFLNGVCSKTIHLTSGTDGLPRLDVYGGNFDMYQQTRKENEVNRQKRYEKEQEDIKHLKEFISSCGTYSNLVKQAQSKQKIIDKMVEAGLTPKVVPDPVFRFSFPNSPKLAPPVMAFQKVAFAYSGKKEDYLYTDLDFGIDCDSRIALVGPNGAGKSTLLKLMTLELEPTEGDVRKNPHLRIGRYNPHSEDVP